VKSLKNLAALVVASVALVACDLSSERAIETPVTRTFKWFGYVAGDDIRAACGRDNRNRIRLVYNALWEEQVRTYDINLPADGTSAFTTRVIAEQGVVSNILISDWNDITSPWNAKRGERLLDRAQTAEVMGLLQQSAAFGPPREGMRLPDNDFWWTAASCLNGRWGFQAWHFPTDRFANVRFADKLFTYDPVTAVPVSRPRPLEPAEVRRNMQFGSQRDRADRWMLVVGKDGLAQR
jgi:hypothetical protein